MTPHTKFEAEVHPDEGRGGRHTPFFELPPAVLLPHDGRDRVRDAAGRHRDGDAGRQREDDRELINPMAMDEGLRFAIREGKPSAPASQPVVSRGAAQRRRRTCRSLDTRQSLMADQKIRIRLKAFDHRLIDRSASEIVETAKRTGAQVRGPDPAADQDRTLHRGVAARRQGRARPVRDPHAQARARHRRPQRQDRGRADEARTGCRRRRPDQVDLGDRP